MAEFKIEIPIQGRILWKCLELWIIFYCNLPVVQKSAKSDILGFILFLKVLKSDG